MQKLAIISGALLSALGVAIGAFGAHGLKSVLTINERLDTFETGVKYHMYHALGLILLGILLQYFPHKYISTAVWFFIAGIIIFSGSLYTLSITNIRILGAITPLGGVAFIVGWVLLALGIYKYQ